MRVLVTTDQWFADFQGGSARVATDTARALAARGHDVTVIAPRHQGQPTAMREGSLTVLRELPRGLIPQTISDPVHVYRVARGPTVPFDVLLAHQPSNMVGLLAARLRVPVVLVFHASVPRELRFLRTKVPFGRERIAATLMTPLLASLENRAVRRATTILILSQFSRTLLEADHPNDAGKARLVGGGVDTQMFSPGDGQGAARRRLGLASDGPLIFTVRRLEPRMGIEPLLTAVSQLPASLGVQLAVAGSGMLEPQIRELAHELEIADRVTLLGRVPDEALSDWYRAADLFVIPTVAYEGFGMVTAEALASGTPVVGTPVGATPELLGPLDPRLVAPSADAEDLAATIANVLRFTGPELRSRCREYATERFDWTHAIVTWEHALEAAARTPRRSPSETRP